MSKNKNGNWKDMEAKGSNPFINTEKAANSKKSKVSRKPKILPAQSITECEMAFKNKQWKIYTVIENTFKLFPYYGQTLQKQQLTKAVKQVNGHISDLESMLSKTCSKQVKMNDSEQLSAYKMKDNLSRINLESRVFREIIRARIALDPESQEIPDAKKQKGNLTVKPEANHLQPVSHQESTSNSNEVDWSMADDDEANRLIDEN